MSFDIFFLFKGYLDRATSLSKSDKIKVNEIVSHAIRFTRTHISRTRENKTDIPSQMLSTIWQEAANKLKRFGNEDLKRFAKTLENKSKYWSDPDGFRPDVLDEYGMLLTQVETKLEELTE
jgi:hypothetical protein